VAPVLIAVVVLTGVNVDSPAAASAKIVAGHPLAQLLLAIAAVVAACKTAGWLVHRIGQPPVIGEITAGIVLGPSVLGWLWPAAQTALIPKVVVPQLNVLAQLGVVLFVFLTGLELNTKLLRGRGHVAGGGEPCQHRRAIPARRRAGRGCLRQVRPHGVGALAFALFLGVSMSITALRGADPHSHGYRAVPQ